MAKLLRDSDLGFSSGQRIPYISLVKEKTGLSLGVNSVVDLASESPQLVTLSDVSIQVEDNFMVVAAKIAVYPGTWVNREYQSVLADILEAPKEDVSDNDGIWTLQFGWNDRYTLNTRSQKMRLALQGSSITYNPNVRGSIDITITLVPIQMSYLDSVVMGMMTNVRELVSSEQKQAITLDSLFAAIGRDLAVLYPSPQANVPTEADFKAAIDNWYNLDVDIIHSEFFMKPLNDTTALAKCVQEETANVLTLRRFLIDVLSQNGMALYPVYWSSPTGFFIRIPMNTDRSESQNGKTITTKLYSPIPNEVRSTLWRPALDVFSKEGLLTDLSFEISEGEATLWSIQARSRTLGIDSPLSRVSSNTNTAIPNQHTSDQDEAYEETQGNVGDYYFTALMEQSKKCSFTMLGNCEVCPLDYFEIRSNNPLFDGIYLVDGVTHTLSQTEFTTAVSCYRMVKLPIDLIGSVRHRNVITNDNA